jgi:pilus assembly protein CpaB
MSDYLWDKSGRDEQVEQLEATLGALRFDAPPPDLERDRRAPVAPAPRAPVHRPPPGFRFGSAGPLAASLVLAVAAAVISWSALHKREADVRRGWNLVPVVVAAVDVAEGAVVTVEMMSQRSIPEQFVTSSVIKPDSANFVAGQKVLVPVAAGDPLLWSQFETTRARERLSSKVLKKARALSIMASGAAALGGWLRPNDHVDLIGSFKDPTSGEQVAVTLLQNVLVLATGKLSGTTNVNLVPEAEREYGNVSVLVLPEEAELLVLAQELGALNFTLRNEDDVDLMQERGRATINTLLSGERTRVLQARRFNTIQVIRGSTATPAKTP